MLSRQVSLPDLIDLCRVLRHQLGAGMSVQQVMQKQGERGRASLRGITGRIGAALLKGSSLSDALEKEPGVFPVLFLSMVKLGEETGHMAELFGELERYYQLELQLRRQFRSQTFLPIVQFVFAVAIVTGVTIILNVINPARPLLTYHDLGIMLGSVALIGVLCFLAAFVGRRQAWKDRIILSMPALGPCLYSILMSRFTLALQLTLDSGLSITKALRLSLEATGNAHFASHADGIVKALKSGKPLYDALAANKLFANDHFLDMVASSEASGSVPEMMKHLAAQYQEEAGRRLTFLTKVAGGLVWCCVAGFMIWAIFKLWGIYFGMLQGI